MNHSNYLQVAYSFLLVEKLTRIFDPLTKHSRRNGENNFRQAFENSSKVTDCPITRTSRFPLVVRALIISSSAVISRPLRRRTTGRFTFRSITRLNITSNCNSHK